MKTQKWKSAINYLDNHCYDNIKPEKRTKCLESIYQSEIGCINFLSSRLFQNDEEADKAYEIIQRNPLYIGILFRRMSIPEPYRTNCFELVIDSDSYGDLIKCAWRLHKEEKERVLVKAEKSQNPGVNKDLLYHYMLDKNITKEKMKYLISIASKDKNEVRELFERFHLFPEEIQTYLIDKLIENNHFGLVEEILKKYHEKLTKSARARLRSFRLANKLLE